MVHARTGAAAAAQHALQPRPPTDRGTRRRTLADALARLLQANTSLLLRDAPTARALARQARELLGVLDAPLIHTSWTRPTPRSPAPHRTPRTATSPH